jgi:hypothetical protein
VFRGTARRRSLPWFLGTAFGTAGASDARERQRTVSMQLEGAIAGTLFSGTSPRLATRAATCKQTPAAPPL